MAAPLVALSRSFCRRPSLLSLCCRRLLSARTPPKPPLYTRLLNFLIYHVEEYEAELTKISKHIERRIKEEYDYVKTEYGPDYALMSYILKINGGIRLRGLPQWFRLGQFSPVGLDTINKDTCIEEVDLSYTLINLDSLRNFREQTSLRGLYFKGCPGVNDWFLTRLHIFEDTLETLDISHCPNITTGGLAALRNLKGLRRLDISSMPGITNPGLVVILLEEMLPNCLVTATGYDFSFPAKEEEKQLLLEEGSKGGEEVKTFGMHGQLDYKDYKHDIG